MDRVGSCLECLELIKTLDAVLYIRPYDVQVSARATLLSEKRSDIWDHFVCVDMGVDLRFVGFILTQWGMQFFNVFHSFCICNGLALSLIFTSFFSCLTGFSLSFSFRFHAHLWRTAKLNCLSLHRWTQLAMPGWQATRGAPWMATPTRANMTSSSWNSMPRVCTCGRASAVVRAVTLLTPFRQTGCDFVFESFHGRETWKNFRSSCEVHFPSHVECHHHLNESICWVPLQGRYLVFVGSLTDVFRHL